MSDYITADDGLPARKSQAYAKEKLAYVSKYMHMFATGMNSSWRHRVYLDLMAGPGLCRIKDTGEEFDGSPLRSLSAEFTRRLFVEDNPKHAAALKTRVDQRAGQAVDVISGDCNKRGTISQLRLATDGDDVLSLAFVDNLGLNVPFKTLAQLVEQRQTDLLIVVQLQHLTRNAFATSQGEQDGALWDEFFGTDAWRALLEEANQKNVRPLERTRALEELYLTQFSSIGYRHVAKSPDAMKNKMNAVQYRLVLASRSPKAVEFFNEAHGIEPEGQRRLLP